jgi:hypothetical protein
MTSAAEQELVRREARRLRIPEWMVPMTLAVSDAELRTIGLEDRRTAPQGSIAPAAGGSLRLTSQQSAQARWEARVTEEEIDQWIAKKVAGIAAQGGDETAIETWLANEGRHRDSIRSRLAGLKRVAAENKRAER